MDEDLIKEFTKKETKQRNADRIEPFLQELGELWKQRPDTRFGQMMVGFRYWLEHNGYGDGFYIEDEKFIELFAEFFDAKEQK